MDSERFRFGLFEFDPATRELRREGRPVRLQAQPAQVLAALLQNAGQVVSREELRSAVWGEGTFVDFERGLNFCIGQIRAALDDDPVTARYLRTLPRRGYQFIAPVERLPRTAERSEGTSERPGFPRAALGWAAALLLALALGAGYWLRVKQSARRIPVVAVVRFDNETGDPALTRWSDGLTDALVAQLTSLGDGRFGVIGNAAILRLPREQRDLRVIASSLAAGYVILGQVQTGGQGTRLLAHLIRMPEQTHLGVVRMDRPAGDLPKLESEAAIKIASEFSERLVKDARGTSPPAATRSIPDR